MALLAVGGVVVLLLLLVGGAGAYWYFKKPASHRPVAGIQPAAPVDVAAGLKPAPPPPATGGGNQPVAPVDKPPATGGGNQPVTAVDGQPAGNHQKFFPGNSELVVSVKVDEILSGNFYSQLKKDIPGLEEMLDFKKLTDETGLVPADISQVIAAVYFTGASPEGVGIVKMKKAVTAEELLAKHAGPPLKKETVGRYTVYLESEGGVCLVDGKTIVVGSSKALRDVLTRDKEPELSLELKRVLQQADFSKTVAVAANLKGIQAQQAAMLGGSVGLDPAKTDKLLKSMDGIVVQATLASDVDLTVTVLCADARAAEEIKTQLTDALAPLKQNPDALPKEIKDVLDKTTFSTNGSSVVVASRFAVAPLIKVVMEVTAGPGPGKPSVPKSGLEQLSAEQLTQVYATDPKGFEEKYKDKVIVVEGLVTSPDVVDDGLHWLILAGYKKAGDPVAHQVNCTFVAAFQDMAARLPRGSKVKVKGKCQGHKATMFAARLTECTLLEGKVAAQEPALTGTALPLTDVQLAREHDTGGLATLKKYTGQVLEITGVVLSAYPTDLYLKGTYDTQQSKGRQIYCRMAAASQEQASELTRGQEVKIKGRYQTEGNAYLIANCELVWTGPDPAVPVTAMQLTQEYSKDAAVADKTYLEKQVLVEGVIAELREDKTGFEPRAVIVLESFDEKAARPLRVQAVFPNSDKKPVANLAKGQKIKIKGQCVGVKDGSVTLWYIKIVKPG